LDGGEAGEKHLIFSALQLFHSSLHF